MSIIVSFVNHDDLLSRGILLKTGGEYAHAEALTPRGTIIGAFAEGGVQERPRDYDGGKFKKKLFLLLSDADDDMSARFYHFLDAVVAKKEPYAFFDILDFVLPFDFHERQHVFCSALIDDGLRGCSYFPVPLPIWARYCYPVLLQQMLLVRPGVRPVTPDSPEFLAHIGAAPP